MDKRARCADLAQIEINTGIPMRYPHALREVCPQSIAREAPLRLADLIGRAGRRRSTHSCWGGGKGQRFRLPRRSSPRRSSRAVQIEYRIALPRSSYPAPVRRRCAAAAAAKRGVPCALQHEGRLLPIDRVEVFGQHVLFHVLLRLSCRTWWPRGRNLLRWEARPLVAGGRRVGHALEEPSSSPIRPSAVKRPTRRVGSCSSVPRPT